MKINYINSTLIAAFISCSLSSCLKDESLTADTTTAENIIEFVNPTSAGSSGKIYPVVTNSFEVTPTGEFDIIIRYSGSQNAPEDITVNIAVDPSAITNFNNKIVDDARAAAIEADEDPDEAEDEVQDELYDVMPTDLYTLSATKVIIKKGEKEARIKVSVKPDQFDFNEKYGVPLTIISSSLGTISSNFRTVIFNIGAKNEYDGDYTFDVVISGGVDEVISGEEEHLVTVDQKTVSKDVIGEYFGGYTTYTFNEDGTISVGAFAAPGGTSYGASVLESSYDSATGNFHVKFTILNGAYTFDETAVRN